MILAKGKYHLAGSRFPAANACTIEPSDDRLYPTNFPAGRYPLECLSLPLMFLTLFTGCHWVVLYEAEGDMNRRVIARGKQHLEKITRNLCSLRRCLPVFVPVFEAVLAARDDSLPLH